MGRASRQDAERHREQVIEHAAELFRERGIAGVSVPDVMGAAGLTHGGFYRHFGSKDELAALACTRAIEQQDGVIDELRQSADPERASLDYYLSPEHRDDPGHGCPIAALSGEMARLPADNPAHEAYVEGVRGFADGLGSVAGADADRAETLVRMSTMIGALVLSRASKGDPISDEILAAARVALTPS